MFILDPLQRLGIIHSPMIFAAGKHFVQIFMSWIFHQKGLGQSFRYRTLNKNTDFTLSLLQCIIHSPKSGFQMK